MFGVDEGGQTASLLCLGNRVQRQGRLTGGFRSEDLDHPAFGVSAYSQRHIQRNGAGGNHCDLFYFLAAHPHDGPFAEILLYFVQYCVQYFQFVCIDFFFLCHIFMFFSILIFVIRQWRQLFPDSGN